MLMTRVVPSDRREDAEQSELTARRESSVQSCGTNARRHCDAAGPMNRPRVKIPVVGAGALNNQRFRISPVALYARPGRLTRHLAS